MLEETIDALALDPGASVVDATFGGGGHSRAILDRLGPGGSLVGIDRDPEAAGRASDLLEDPRFEFVSGAYDGALWAMVERGRKADAILFDLGLSSFQVDEPERGFSYVGEGPLDMRMDPGSGVSAARVPEHGRGRGAGARALSSTGTCRGARRAGWRGRSSGGDRSSHDRPVRRRACGGRLERRGGNPAKRIFQAVRVEVNDELG